MKGYIIVELTTPATTRLAYGDIFATMEEAVGKAETLAEVTVCKGAAYAVAGIVFKCRGRVIVESEGCE